MQIAPAACREKGREAASSWTRRTHLIMWGAIEQDILGSFCWEAACHFGTRGTQTVTSHPWLDCFPAAEGDMAGITKSVDSKQAAVGVVHWWSFGSGGLGLGCCTMLQSPRLAGSLQVEEANSTSGDI